MKRLIQMLLRAMVGTAFLAVLVGGVALLHMRAAQSKRADAHTLRPIPVASFVAEAADGFDINDRFVGRIEPARQVRIAFERGGLVTQVLVEEGQFVAKGEIIAKLDTALLQALLARRIGERIQIAAKLELARLTEKRKRVLQRQSHVSMQSLDEARLATTATKGELAAIDAVIRGLGIDISKSVVHAPFGGTVGARFIDPGVVVAAATFANGTPVIDLLETSRPQARIGLSPDAAAHLSVGEAVQLSSRGLSLNGRVVAIRPDISTSTRTIGVLIDVPVIGDMHFGNTVELQIKRHIEREGFWLPLTALNEGERGLWTVLTLKAGTDGAQRVGSEAVELMHTQGDRVFVRGTLRAGQRVIESGRNRVIPGQHVELIAAAGDVLSEEFGP